MTPQRGGYCYLLFLLATTSFQTLEELFEHGNLQGPLTSPIALLKQIQGHKDFFTMVFDCSM